MVVGIAGCSPSMTKVKGKVTFQGKPVVWGSVTLADAKGQFYQGEINLDGTYEIENVPPGPVKIGVYSPKPEDEHTAGGRTKSSTGGARGAVGRGGGAGGGQAEDPRERFIASQGGRQEAPPRPKPAPGQWFPIPDKNNDPMKSELVGAVKPNVDLNIELKE